MRVWDIHPGYLSDKSLLGEHVEIHALYSIISGGKNGYSQHPETKRWTGHLQQLNVRHNLVVKEMGLRGFNHNSPLLNSMNIHIQKPVANFTYVDLPVQQFIILNKKYLEKNLRGRIPLPRSGTEFWAHHKYSVMARGYQYYKEIQKFFNGRYVYPIDQEHAIIEKILSYMKIEISQKALDNVILHLWGYFKDKADEEEKKCFFNLSDSVMKMSILFDMTWKYQKDYLLHSTIFADLLNEN